MPGRQGRAHRGALARSTLVTSSEPPASSTRSRMPSRPKPSLRFAGSKPVPSSVTHDGDGVVVLEDIEPDGARIGMGDGVVERLLHQPVYRRFQLGLVARRMATLLVGEIDVASTAGPLVPEAVHESLDRRLDPEVVEGGGPQLGDQRAQVVDLVLDLADRRCRSPPPRSPALRCGVLSAGRRQGWRAPGGSRRGARAPSAGAPARRRAGVWRRRSSATSARWRPRWRRWRRSS